MRILPSRRVSVVFALFVLAFLHCLRSQAEKLSKQEQWLQNLASATSLDRADVRPWHMHLTFQLYDLEGKASDAGTLDAWWPGKGKPLARVATPILQGDLPDMAQAEQGTAREVYLLRELLTEIVHPVPEDFNMANYELEDRTRTFGKTQFRCLHAQWIKGRRIEAMKNPSAHEWSEDDPEFCTDVSDPNVLRIRLDIGHLSVARNRLGMFESAHIGYDNDLAYGGKLAISGRIDTLEVIDPVTIPADAKPILTSRDLPGVLEPPMKVSGQGYGNVAGRSGGSFVMSLLIDTDGHVSRVVPLASTDAHLVAPVANVINTWRFKPAKRDGQPIVVDIVTTVNFRPM